MKLSRRFLLGAGGASLALPLLESLMPRNAYAAGMPSRLLVFVTHEGTVLPRWMPATGALTNNLSQLLAPLNGLSQKLTVVSGVSNRVAGLCSSNGHNASSRTLLSAALTATAADSNGNLIARGSQAETGTTTGSVGASFDQSIASALGVRPINLSIATPEETRMFFQTAPAVASQPNGARAEVDQLSDAVSAFNQFIAPNLSMGPVDAGTPAVAPFSSRLQQRRAKVLDPVNESLKALKTKVSAADKLRLEQHEDSIERFEASAAAMQPVDAGTGMPAAMRACQPQSLPANYANRSNDYYAWYSAQIDVMVNALACNVTRIATFQDQDMYSPPFQQFMASPPAALSALGAVAFPPMQSDWHSNVHGASGGGVGDNQNNSSLNAGFTFYAAMFRLLLERMNSIVEPNGATLLDNSLVVWISEFGSGGSHSTENLPIVIAGSNQGRFTTGRHVALAGASTDAYLNGGATTNDLYLSLHRQMGVTSLTRFGYAGDASLHHGGIAELER